MKALHYLGSFFIFSSVVCAEYASNPATSYSFQRERNPFDVSIEYLYFQAIEDSLLYATKVPQNSTYKPVTKTIDQEPGWSSGGRVSFESDLPYDQWRIGIDYTFYYSKPPSRSEKSENYSILAVQVVPIFGSNGNTFVNKVHGDWKLAMNVVDLFLKKELDFADKFAFNPLFGVKACAIFQRTNVHYDDFRLDFPAENTPKKVLSKSELWGLGPMLGFEAIYSLPHQVALVLESSFALFWGAFDLETKYKDFFQAPSNAKIVLKDDMQRIFPNAQIKIGVSKEWALEKDIGFCVSAGWEMQMWWRQMRMNWFSTLVTPPSGGDLSLNGFFVNAQAKF